MFRNATSYLWGSSDSAQQKKKESKIEKKYHHHSTASLPDLSALDEVNDKKKELSASSSMQSLTKNIYNVSFSGPITEIILDKHSKHKISATSKINILFDDKGKEEKKSENSKKMFFIASNRNALYKNLYNSPKLIMDDNNKDNKDDLNKYLNSLTLTSDEINGILELIKWTKTEKIANKMGSELYIAEIIITYFSSLSPTNPDLYGCWKKWTIYRHDHSLYNLSAIKTKKYFDSGILSLGFDKDRRPVIFINTDKYLDYNLDKLGAEIISYASMLWVSSLLWNLKKNEFDLFALRRGISVYINLSHWSVNMASWSIIKGLKQVLIAYPFHLVDIYVSNIPTFMYLLKQIAAKVIVPHAMEKFIILSDPNDYFTKYGQPKHKTPICAGGTLKVSATNWMIDRGYLDYIKPVKHNKSPSEPQLNINQNIL